MTDFVFSLLFESVRKKWSSYPFELCYPEPLFLVILNEVKDLIKFNLKKLVSTILTKCSLRTINHNFEFPEICHSTKEKKNKHYCI